MEFIFKAFPLNFFEIFGGEKWDPNGIERDPLLDDKFEEEEKEGDDEEIDLGPEDEDEDSPDDPDEWKDYD